MSLAINEWGSFDKVGKGYGFKIGEKFYSILETKAGAYRGNHTHPYNQYTLLLSGQGKYLKIENGLQEVPMVEGKIVMVKAGIAHILLPEKDSLTFEWWDGDFIATNCKGLFDEFIRGKVGPQDYQK